MINLSSDYGQPSPNRTFGCVRISHTRKISKNLIFLAMFPTLYIQDFRKFLVFFSRIPTISYREGSSKKLCKYIKLNNESSKIILL